MSRRTGDRQLRAVVTTWLAAADITDEQQRARLRATIIVLLAVLSLPAIAVGLLFGTSSQTAATARSTYIVLAVNACLAGVWSGIRRARLREGEYTFLLIFGVVDAALGVLGAPGAGQVLQTANAQTVPVLLAALFCERRRGVVAVTAAGLTMVVVAVAHAHDSRGAVSDAISGALVLVLLAFALRLLRDLAVRSTTRAAQGEVTDPLTGLANRRGLERFIAREWQARAVNRACIALIAVDVDHFKDVNDSLGHAAGDEVLRRLAEILASSIRSGDLAVRLGGEEFLLLCSVPSGEGRTVAERLRRAVESGLAPRTVSIGVHEIVAASTDAQPEAVWAAVEIADTALYEAKRTGRNRVVVAAPAPAAAACRRP